MPFLPVFGGGTSLFQPVFAGDIAKLVYHLSGPGADIFNGKVIEAGGPEGRPLMPIYWTSKYI